MSTNSSCDIQKEEPSFSQLYQLRPSPSILQVKQAQSHEDKSLSRAHFSFPPLTDTPLSHIVTRENHDPPHKMGEEEGKKEDDDCNTG